jgi:hypothetical protein
VDTSSNQKWTSPAVDQVKVNWDAVKIMLYTGCSNGSGRRFFFNAMQEKGEREWTLTRRKYKGSSLRLENVGLILNISSSKN